MSVMLFVLLVGQSAASKVDRQDGQLDDCPDSPNCACTDATNPDRWIAPFNLQGDQQQAWATIREMVAELSRCRVVKDDGLYLHLECRSALFGFVDDLELQLRPEQGIVAVRSAARSGYYDFGVNRRRLERLRDELIAAEVVRTVD